ncbi:MAG TPA: DegV family protein [Thermomicrobiaceae bacterium]|nr:DegV family protein [Thermomicrobiaceae bacterium]
MARVAVVTDSTADIPPELAAELGVHVVPLTVRLGSDVFEDRVTITPSEFMRRLAETGDFPSTSQPPVGRFQALYDRLAEDHDGVVSIHLSSRLSGTYQSACLARDGIDGRLPIAVIDSRSASMGLGFPVLRAARAAREGRSLDDLVQLTHRAIDATSALFLVDTLEYLRRGGRIGRAAEIVGSILQLKPILRLEEGLVVPFARTRTLPRATAGLIDAVRDFPVIDRLAILHTTDPRPGQAIADALADRCPRDRVVFSQFSPVLAAHIGPGAVGVVVYEGDDVVSRERRP